MVMRCQSYMHRNSSQLHRLECWQEKMMSAFGKLYLTAMSSTEKLEQKGCVFEA